MVDEKTGSARVEMRWRMKTVPFRSSHMQSLRNPNDGPPNGHSTVCGENVALPHSVENQYGITYILTGFCALCFSLSTEPIIWSGQKGPSIHGFISLPAAALCVQAVTLLQPIKLDMAYLRAASAVYHLDKRPFQVIRAKTKNLAEYISNLRLESSRSLLDELYCFQ